MTDQTGATPRIMRYAIRESVNKRWNTQYNQQLMTLTPAPVIGPNDKIFAIGCQTVRNISLALDEMGYQVGPKTADIALDPERFRIDNLPKLSHLTYSNSYSILQEFRRFSGHWTPGPDDYWTIDDPIWGGEKAYQDPYRRLVIGRTPQDLHEATEKLTASISAWLSQADVFVLSVTTPEVFVDIKSRQVAFANPGHGGGGGKHETVYYCLDYSQNLNALQRVVDIIKYFRPEAKVIVSLAPLPAAQTFGNNDILVADCENKSVLRAAIGQLARSNENVHYFPSYEMVLNNRPESLGGSTGRSAAPWMMTTIIDVFKQAYLVDADHEAALKINSK